MKQLFVMGRVFATTPAIEALKSNGQNAFEFLERHATGDWGCVDKHDTKANEKATKYGFRIFSAYRLKDASEIWVVTEANGPEGRASTCVLLPDR